MYIDDYLIIVTFSDVFLVQNIHSKVKSSTTTSDDPHGDGKKVFRGVPAEKAFTKDNYEGHTVMLTNINNCKY